MCGDINESACIEKLVEVAFAAHWQGRYADYRPYRSWTKSGVIVETFIPLRSLVDNPLFGEQRVQALRQLKTAVIDVPIVRLISGFAELPYCFTLQSCYGHFLHANQLDSGNVECLPPSAGKGPVDYRIAYIALCVDNCDEGITLMDELSRIPRVDRANVQFGCATWFWRQQVNSYALQVEPGRYKTRDSITIDYQEALRLQRVRDACFAELAGLVDSRVRIL